MIRIISGEFRGHKLKSGLDRLGFRPTKDRVKESLFSILGDLSGQTVLDIFSGSGSLGFEALSRGAKKVIFVENNFKQTKIIKDNAEKLKIIERVEIIPHNVISFLKNCNNQFDLIIADPPYQYNQIEDLINIILDKFHNSKIVLETATNYDISGQLLEIKPQVKIYGNSKLLIFKV